LADCCCFRFAFQAAKEAKKEAKHEAKNKERWEKEAAEQAEKDKIVAEEVSNIDLSNATFPNVP
jgi:hypothetical protein